VDHVYKTIELVGSSTAETDDAIRNAVAKAAQTCETFAGCRSSRRGGILKAVKWNPLK
jgi:flavin-binding protein dodecin